MTTQQRFIKQFVEEHYDDIIKLLRQKDCMHSAYITVYTSRRPFLPTRERVYALLDDAYHRHMLQELNYRMHFCIPDPIFWQLQDEVSEQEQAAPFDTSPTNSENEEKNTFSFSDTEQCLSFVKDTFSPTEARIFQLAVSQLLTEKEIAMVIGKPRRYVHATLQRIEDAIVEHETQKRNNSTEQNS